MKRLIACCLLLLGICPVTAQPKPGKPLADDLALIPADAMMVNHLKVADLWKNDALKEVRSIYAKAGTDALAAFDKRFVSLLKKVDRVTLYVPRPDNASTTSDIRMITVVKLSEPLEKKQVDDLFADKVFARKGKYADFQTDADGYVGFRVLSPTLMVFGDASAIQEMCDREKVKADGVFKPLLQQANESSTPYIFAFTLHALPADARKQMAEFLPKPLQPMMKASLVSATLDFEHEIRLQANLVYGNEKEADEAEQAVKAATAMALDTIRTMRGDLIDKIKGDGKPGQIEKYPEAAVSLIGLGALRHAEDVLRSKPVKREGTTLSMSVALPPQMNSVAGAWALSSLVSPLATRKLQEATFRMRSSNNLKQIGLAMHAYHDTYGQLPPAAIVDKKGKSLLSWRVAILPFIEQELLYKQFKLDEPWDSEHNLKLAENVVKVYENPGVRGLKTGHTHYRVFVNNGALFDRVKGTPFTAVTDGLSNTIMVVEAAESVPWTKPDDLEFDPTKEVPKLGNFYRNGFHALYADGAVYFHAKVPFSIKLRIQRNDGQAIGAD